MYQLPERARVLVACKETRLNIYKEAEDPLVERLQATHQTSIQKLRDAHREHMASIKVVEQELARRGWEWETLSRAEIDSVENFDLVITVGGDGTVLDLSHHIEDETPILGVNSSPSHSVGYFCACRALDLRRTIDGVLAGSVKIFKLCRLHVYINGERRGVPVLNDILITDSNPAATSRYVLRVGGRYEERQRSSGIWVATPAGSTAAIRSAGGSVLPLNTRLLQYRVREPYLPMDRRYHHLGGVQEVEETLSVISLMAEGCIYIDGPYYSYPFGLGDMAEIRGDAPPLVVLGLDETSRFV